MTPDETLDNIISQINAVIEENHDYYNLNLNKAWAALRDQAKALKEAVNKFDKEAWGDAP